MYALHIPFFIVIQKPFSLGMVRDQRLYRDVILSPSLRSRTSSVKNLFLGAKRSSARVSQYKELFG
jgi:hypothetical protein